jgi:hypothetical protein
MSDSTDRAGPINPTVPPPDPKDYEGPLNVFIELHGTAEANNRATQTRIDYEQLHPEPPADPLPPPPVPAPLGAPVSAGRRVSVDLTDTRRFFIDREITTRIRHRR